MLSITSHHTTYNMQALFGSEIEQAHLDLVVKALPAVQQKSFFEAQITIVDQLLADLTPVQMQTVKNAITLAAAKSIKRDAAAVKRFNAKTQKLQKQCDEVQKQLDKAIAARDHYLNTRLTEEQLYEKYGEFADNMMPDRREKEKFYQDEVYHQQRCFDRAQADLQRHLASQ